MISINNTANGCSLYLVVQDINIQSNIYKNLCSGF